MKDGEVRASQRLGANVNYSPEFNAMEPNLNLLRRIAESGKGKLMDPSTPELNPFLAFRRLRPHPRLRAILRRPVYRPRLCRSAAG
jgi:hypothetical protein